MAGKAPQYIGGSSEKQYQKEAHKRMRQNALRDWLVRLVVLAVIVAAAKMWGPSLLAAIKHQGESTVSSVEKGGQGIKAGVDERSGANFKEDK